MLSIGFAVFECIWIVPKSGYISVATDDCPTEVPVMIFVGHRHFGDHTHKWTGFGNHEVCFSVVVMGAGLNEQLVVHGVFRTEKTLTDAFDTHLHFATGGGGFFQSLGGTRDNIAVGIVGQNLGLIIVNKEFVLIEVVDEVNGRRVGISTATVDIVHMHHRLLCSATIKHFCRRSTYRFSAACSV